MGGAKGSSSHNNNNQKSANQQQQQQQQQQHQSSSSSSSRKSRLENSDKKPPISSNPKSPNPSPTASETRPRPQPAYGVHMLDRRSITLADGSVRSYFALPPDYDHPPHHRHNFPLLGPMSPEISVPMGGAKRKFLLDDDRDMSWPHLFHLSPNANPNFIIINNNNNNPAFLPGPSNPSRDEFRMPKQIRLGFQPNNQVDPTAFKKAFLNFVKLINENSNLKKLYLDHGRKHNGPLNCVICGRSARDFPDMHTLIMHAYNPDRADQLVDHLGLHKALCLLMGWNYSRAPDNSKAYQSLSASEAEANQDDVILWPPTVVVHNTITGKGKEGRMEGLGNKAMDAKLRELGFASGKAKSVYGKEGHMGITLVKFSADPTGLKEAVRLAEFLEREKHGRKGWARVQSSSTMGKDDENNPNLMELDKKGEKQRVLYGYLGTVFDLDKLDFETRKKIQIETRRDFAVAK